MRVLHLDWETKSAVDLRKCGAYKYAEDPSTDILCAAWAFDDEEPQIWTPDQGSDDMPPLCRWCEQLVGGHHCRGCGARQYGGLPLSIVDHVEAGGEIRAWNAAFERLIWRGVAVRRYGFPEARLEQFVCTMAEAAAMALPLALDQCAEVLGVEQQKDAEGKRLMLKHCKPKTIHPDGRAEWHPYTVSDARRIGEYCRQDLRTERAVEPCLRRLVPRERAIYLLDQRMNDRGIGVDLELASAARKIADEGIARANAELAELTGGVVEEVTKAKRLTAYLNDTGTETDGVSKKVVAALLEGELPADTRRILELRTDAGRSSLAKLDVMPLVACMDGRARGLVQYHVASTGRWGGRLLQPQNFARPEDKNPERFIPDVLRGDYDLIDLLHKHPISVVVDLLRSMLTAGPGMELIAGDFKSVEAVVLNWLADEREILELFRQYLAGDKSKDPYKRMAVKMGRAGSVELVTAQDRQAGKAAELGCGFGMGRKKYVTAAWDVYQVRVNEAEAESAVNIYRDTHPNVKEFWYGTERAAIEAVTTPGVPVKFGGLHNLTWYCQGAYLYCILPSKRPLVYAKPKIVMAPTPWGEEKESLEYSGRDPYTKKWGRIRTYGGHLVENIVQAVARDLMADKMLAAEARGYPPVGTVHDEIITEVPFGFGSVEEFEQIMCEVPEWAAGCPIGAEGWRGVRYRK